jgi:hypothetical protein
LNTLTTRERPESIKEYIIPATVIRTYYSYFHRSIFAVCNHAEVATPEFLSLVLTLTFLAGGKVWSPKITD